MCLCFVLLFCFVLVLYLILYSSYSSILLPILLLFHPSLIPILSSSSIFLISHPHSFYTCRSFLMFIYVPSVSDNLTPHVLSEWMVEVCRFEVCVCVSCCCSVSCWCYILYYTLPILLFFFPSSFSSILPSFQSSPLLPSS